MKIVFVDYRTNVEIHRITATAPPRFGDEVLIDGQVHRVKYVRWVVEGGRIVEVEVTCLPGWGADYSP